MSMSPKVQSSHTSGVSLRTEHGTFRLQQPSLAQASQWAYLVRNRRRWAGREERRRMSERCSAFLTALGATEDCLRAVSHSTCVEVALRASPVPSTSHPQIDVRVFPWEYVLSAATEHRRTKRLCVVRHAQGAPRPAPASRGRLLFIESAPGDLRSHFSFQAEHDLIASSFEADQARDPSLQELTDKVATLHPAAIHLSGIDTHQGAALLCQPDPSYDGVWLSADDSTGHSHAKRGTPFPYDAHAVAKALVPSSRPPQLVCLNLYNSAPRLASTAVELGAAASIGFQDAFDDLYAEVFFANLYDRLRQRSTSLLSAFMLALESVPLDSIHGTGVVLWSATSQLGDRSARRVKVLDRSVALVQKQAVEVQVRPFVNYSLLHNSEGLFHRFRYFRPANGPARDLDVEVELDVGGERFPYRRRVSGIGERVVDLARDAHVPLTSQLVRSTTEHVRSSLYVHVRAGTHVLHRSSHAVTLLPINEWRDSPSGNFLPSFVLPRDPAVGELIKRAQRYLHAISDSPDAGFKGYQFPTTDLEAAKAAVDQQVQAVWWALRECGLAYNQPLPSFRQQSQRLRSPSEVLTSGRGTCIDLALLLCAALEYVGIDPVLFLTPGHALAGYWRSIPDRDRFRDVSSVLEDWAETASEAELGDPGGEPDWYFPFAAAREIAAAVARAGLRPLECTQLTRAGGFRQSCEDGLQRIRQFDCMMDVALARSAGVTPLPMCQ